MLVTGAGGFVGANLLRRLVADGHRVTGVVRPHSDRWRLADLDGDVELVEVDLCDQDSVRRVVATVRPERAFHLAAHGGYSWQRDVTRIIATNLLATTVLVEACRQAGVAAFVHAGSSSEYGLKDHAPSEDEPLEPNSEYAVAKASATMFCRYAARHDGFPAVTLRLYSVFGPFEDPRRLVPALVAHGLRNQFPPLVAPDVARDFVWVDDVVDALVLAGAAASTRAGAVYNVGTGSQTSVGEIVDIARTVLGIDAEPVWGSMAERAWDTTCWVADNRRIRAELGWEPRTDVAAGLGRTVAWLTANRRLWDVYGVAR